MTIGTGSSDKCVSTCMDVLIYCWSKCKPGTKQYVLLWDAQFVLTTLLVWAGQGSCWRVHNCSSVNGIQHAYAQSLSYWVFSSQLRRCPCLSDCISTSLAFKHISETGFCACLLFRPVSVMLPFALSGTSLVTAPHLCPN